MDKDGDGVSEVEYVIGMLMLMGVRLCDDKLHWNTDVLPLIERFKLMDVANRGKLTRDELTFIVTEARSQFGEVKVGSDESFNEQNEVDKAGRRRRASLLLEMPSVNEAAGEKALDPSKRGESPTSKLGHRPPKNPASKAAEVAL